MEGDESANALLTAIEKAFRKLDPTVNIECCEAAYKERFF
jgi:hypothetical protein